MLIAILTLIAGSVIVLAVTCLVLLRLPADLPPLPRLRRLRDHSIEEISPVGAFLLFLGAGIFLLTAFGIAFGKLLARLEHSVDHPVFRWIARVQDADWAKVMLKVGEMGNIWPTRTVALISIVILTLLAKERRWVPALLITVVVVVQKYDQAALAKLVDRGHPPTTLGTYPSGGCARTLAIYGTVAFLFLAYLRAGRTVRTVTWGVIATLAFIEGYTRTYLNQHWVTDVLGSWVFGGLMLAVVVFAGGALLRRQNLPAAETRVPAEVAG